jgi:hypothetical protein
LRLRAANELEQAEQAREAAANLDPSLIVLNARQMSKDHPIKAAPRAFELSQ